VAGSQDKSLKLLETRKVGVGFPLTLTNVLPHVMH
jgi:hypothetical protein